MTRQDLVIKITELMVQDVELMKRKNSDYSSEEDALSNLKEFGFMGMASKIGDKYCRFKNWVKNGKYEVSDEGILDTLRDLGNFCYLARVMLSEEEIKPYKISKEDGARIAEKVREWDNQTTATYCKKERT